jgi:hypothetical protein
MRYAGQAVYRRGREVVEKWYAPEGRPGVRKLAFAFAREASFACLEFRHWDQAPEAPMEQ